LNPTSNQGSIIRSKDKDKKSNPIVDITSSSILPFTLPVPVPSFRLVPEKSKNVTDSESEPQTGVWSPPESWSVNISQSPKESPVTSQEDLKSSSATPPPQTKAISSLSAVPSSVRLENDVMSCVRVFRREGTFVTVPSALSVSCRDLLSLLTRKFMIQGDNSIKLQLWLVRKGTELLIPLTDRPLRLQQQLLYEVGYDPEHDRFQDILREDNSYLYR
jgi:hypothetical protein